MLYFSGFVFYVASILFRLFPLLIFVVFCFLNGFLIGEIEATIQLNHFFQSDS